MKPVSVRLLSQQLASPQFSDPADVVSHFGAMQAQEYRLMRWAVSMRTRKPSYKAFKEAFDTGRIIRLHLLRGTWQLVSGEDYQWMIELCAPKAEKVIRGWMSANGISIPESELMEIREILAMTAEEKGSATKEDFAEALSERNIAMDGHRLSYHIRMSELCGMLCSGDLLPMKASYSLTSSKIGHGRSIGRDEALSLLARKYFRSHSPATFEDFLWWTGLNVTDCRKGMELIADELHEETWCGMRFILHDSCRSRGFHHGRALLIPPYDEYLIGYKSRDVVLPRQFRAKAHNNSGIFYPVVAHDGLICGNWTPFAGALSVSYFSPDETVMDDESAWSQYLKAREE